MLKIDRTPNKERFNYVVKAALVASFAIAIFFPPDAVGGGHG